MARFARVIALNTPHHITQRGNARRFVLEAPEDRVVYLRLLRISCQQHDLALTGYCLMSNHVHLVAIPRRPDSLPLALKNAHGRYASYFNTRYTSSGHVWQGRYYSCPLDASHFWAALRYVETNPVRAGLVAAAQDYPWSSAPVHCGRRTNDGLLDLSLWRDAWTCTGWREHLLSDGAEQDLELRRNTHTGRPLGPPDFVSALERRLQRTLAPRMGGGGPKQTRKASA